MRLPRPVRRTGGYLLVQLLRVLARVLPDRAGRAVFGTLGLAAGRVLRGDRKRAEENLAAAFTRARPLVCRAMARAVYRNLGRNAWEFLRLEKTPRGRLADRVESVEGIEHLDAALAAGNGALAVTGHIGCWELLPAYFAARDYSLAVVARRMHLSKLNDQLVSIRRSLGVQTLDRDAGARGVIDRLREGCAVGVLIDQHTRVAGVYVPFFGRPAHTPTAVAKLSRMTGAPIVPVAIYMKNNGRHKIHVLPAIEPDRSADRREETDRLTRECSLAVERLIRIDPTQWVWFHNRWRTPKTGDRVLAAQN